MSWRDWAAWQGRLLELGTLHDGESGPYIQTAIPNDNELARAWRKLPRIPLVLEAMHGGDSLRLRYAALDGTYERSAALYEDGVALALDLVTQLLELLRAIPTLDREVFSNPHAYVDFNGQARIVFLERQPRADTREVGFVKAFARMLDEVFASERLDPKDPLSVLARDCSAGRVLDLGAVRAALGKIDHEHYVVMSVSSWNAWRDLDQAIGYELVGNPAMAKKVAGAAREELTVSDVGRAILDELAVGRMWTWTDRGVIPPPVVVPAPREVDLETLDQTREYAAAVAFLQHKQVRTDDEQLAVARCYLALRQHASVVPYARLAQPTAARYAIEVEALLALQRTDELLAAADAWLALAPDEPRAHNARAHALLALGRPAEARAAHDVAAQRGYLPSQFARTNLDRAVKRLASVAGTQGFRELPVPAQLKDLVPLLSQGRLLDAILWLTDRYADPEARALLATCYEYAGDAESALHVHEQDGNLAGIARCLLALGRRDEAFARVGDDAALLDELRELAGLPAERIAWNR